MIDVDELLRRELHLAAEPGEPVGVTELVQARGRRLASRRRAGRIALVVGVMGTFAVVGLFVARELVGLARGSGPRPAEGSPVPGTATTSPILFSGPDFLGPSGSGLLMLNPTTGGIRPLPGTDDLLLVEPSWSPDGSRIAFATEKEPGIHVMNADGSDVHRITTFGDLPDWSPDGSRIAFTRQPEEGLVPPPRLYVVNADGTGLHQIGQGDWPDWSPDGREIAVATEVDHSTDLIQVMNADGTHVRSLGLEGVAPDWSPDGTTIAFTRDDGIYTMRPDGSDVRKLTSAPGMYDAASWSPDGTMIAFGNDPDLTTFVCPGGTGCHISAEEVFVMDADGSHVRQLTHLASRTHPNGGTGVAWAPVAMPLP